MGGANVRDRTLTNVRGDRMEAGPNCLAPGRSWPEGQRDGLGVLLRLLWGAWGIEGGARAVAAEAPQVNGLLRLIFGGGGQAPFGELGPESLGAFPSGSTKRSCVKARLPKVSGPVPGGPGRSQVYLAGRASHVTPGRELGACYSILTCQTSARGPRTLSLLSGGSRGPCPSPFRELGDSRPWSSAG